jgi:hypothetical protein
LKDVTSTDVFQEAPWSIEIRRPLDDSTVALISFVVYLLAAFVQSAYILLPVGIILTIGTLFVIKQVTKDKQ